ncbi:MAG: sugar ABC transporter substrate-binding protein, partial [Anaerolineales bacterium]
MKLRKLFPLLVIIILMTSVVPPFTAAQDDDEITIGFTSHAVGNPFIEQIFDGARAAADDLGVTLIEGGDPAGDPDVILQQVQDLVAAGADGIATSVPGESMANGLNEIIEDGTPVVQFNLLSTSVDAPYVGERSSQSGFILGTAILEELGGEGFEGSAIIGNCFPGFPVLENRAAGVQAALAAAEGLDVSGPFDVRVDAVENYAQWEQLLAANPDVDAMIGLCAPDIASLGQLNEEFGATFVAGGYDLTEDNLTAIEEGHAYVALGQSPFIQGYLSVLMLVESIRNGTDLELSFLDSGSQVVTGGSVDMGFGLPELTFEELIELSADPEATHEYYQPWIDSVVDGGWQG